MLRLGLVYITVCMWVATTHADRLAEEVHGLIARLDDEDKGEANAAIVRLGELGHHAAPAREVLVKLLEDPWFAEEAAVSLVAMGPDTARVVIAAINSGALHPSQRKCLSDLAVAGPEIIDDVLAMEGYQNEKYTRRLTNHFFFYLEPEYIIEVATTLLADDRAAMRRNGATLLRLLGSDAAPALPSLSEALKIAQDGEVKVEIALAMVKSGEPSAAYIEQLADTVMALSNQKGVRDLARRLFRLSGDCEVIARFLLHEPALVRAVDQNLREQCTDELIAAFLDALSTNAGKKRANAAKLLGYVNAWKPTRFAAKDFISLLFDGDPQVVHSGLGIVNSATEIPMDKKLVGRLIELAKHSRSGTPFLAIKILGDHAIDEPGVEQALRAMLEDETQSSQSSILLALGKLTDADAQTIGAIIQKTRSPKESTRWTAVCALGGLKLTSDRVVDAFIGVLDAPGGKTHKDRQAAVRCLAELAERGHISPDVLYSIIEQPLPEPLTRETFGRAVVHSSVITHLYRMGSAAVPVLLELLADRSSRPDAARTLSYLGGLTLEDLSIADDRLGQEFGSVLVLGPAIEEICDDAVPYLLKALQSENAGIRVDAASLFGRIGTRIDVIVPALIALLDDQNFQVVKAAAKALGKLPSLNEKTVEKIENRLSRIPWAECAKLVRELIDARSPLAIPLLTKLSTSPDLDALVMALQGLAELDPQNPELPKLCLSAVERGKPIGQLIPIIKQLGPRVAPVAAKLVPLLKRQSRYQGPRVSDALVSIGPPAVPHLFEGLRAPEWRVRLGAAQALGRISPSDPATILQLETATNDPNYLVAKSARDAIKAIRSSVNAP